jgi:hypothetical protein
MKGDARNRRFAERKATLGDESRLQRTEAPLRWAKGDAGKRPFFTERQAILAERTKGTRGANRSEAKQGHGHAQDG